MSVIFLRIIDHQLVQTEKWRPHAMDNERKKLSHRLTLEIPNAGFDFKIYALCQKTNQKRNIAGRGEEDRLTLKKKRTRKNGG